MQHYRTIVVIGGGCYGAYYVRQLSRASAAGALAFERVVVVDRDPACRVAVDGPPPGVGVVVDDWAAFLAHYLQGAARDGGGSDAIVPSPLMPHLTFEWLLGRARTRWPERTVESRPIGREPSMPWQRSAPDGTHYVSFAEWICPVNCIEPPQCPAIAGPRTWSMPSALAAYVAAERARGRMLSGPAVFHCEHRAYGVGMFDTAALLAADDLVAEAAATSAAEVLVASVSHCHGALGVLAVGAPASTTRSDSGTMRAYASAAAETDD